MTCRAAAAAPARLRGSQRATRPSMPVHAAVGVILENQALCHDVIATCQRIHDAAMVGSRMAVLNEAGRLTQRAVAARDELRALAREIDE